MDIRTVLILPLPTRSVRRFYVYILRCSDGSLYTGYTADLRRRLARHNSGRGSKYTASRLPVELAFAEAVGDRRSAMKREYGIKKRGRGEKLRLCSAFKATGGLSLR